MCAYLLICSLNIDLFVCEFIRMYFFSCTPTGHPPPPPTPILHRYM